MQKICDINSFLPEILLIKESYNLIGQATHLTTSNQKGKPQKLSSLDDHLHAEKLRYHLIPSRDTDEQRIMQSD